MYMDMSSQYTLSRTLLHFHLQISFALRREYNFHIVRVESSQVITLSTEPRHCVVELRNVGGNVCKCIDYCA
jgi:hypothetical protein